MPASVDQFRVFHSRQISLAVKARRDVRSVALMKRVITPFPNVIRAEREKPALARSYGFHDRGDWKANGTGICRAFRRAPQIVALKISRRAGLAACDETSNVCVIGAVGFPPPKEDHTWALRPI